MFFNSELTRFVKESNAIEGIFRNPITEEVVAHYQFLQLRVLTLDDFCDLQKVIAPGYPLRIETGMGVSIGRYLPPRGSEYIKLELEAILSTAGITDPWETHVKYEMLHPFMDGNGRTGRALWAWQMLNEGCDPFVRPFLQSFYYQTLEKMQSPYSR